MAAVNSYTDEFKSLWTDNERETAPYEGTAEQTYAFFGLDSRTEFSRLNWLFSTVLTELEPLCIGRPLANWLYDTVNNNPQVMPPAGAFTAGVNRIQALSMSVMFWWNLQNAQDLTRNIGSLQVLRGLPNAPQAASYFQLITRSGAVRFRPWHKTNFDPIGYTFLSSHRPLYIHDSKFQGTIIYYWMVPENQMVNVFLGTDQNDWLDHGIAPFRTANLAHLAGGTAVQENVAMDAFTSDIFNDVGDLSRISRCLREYETYVTLLEKHLHYTPMTPSVAGGGLPVRLYTYRYEYGVFCAYCWLDQENTNTDLAEIGTYFYQEFASSALARPAAPAAPPRYGWFPVIDINARMRAVVTRISGANEVPINNGANNDATSIRIAGINPVAQLSPLSWKRYFYQQKPFPHKFLYPSNDQDYSRHRMEEIERRRKELYEAELKRKAELRAEMERDGKKQKVEPETGDQPN